MKPNNEQIREFWEKCLEYDEKSEGYTLPNGRYTPFPPPIDLNNLFKYAVPKLANYNMCKGLEPGKPVFGKHIAEVWSNTHGYSKAYSEDPALALFWAIWEAMDEENPTGEEVKETDYKR